MVIYQEYPVTLINPDCTNGRLKVDWYIKTLNVSIEIQGQHHYQATTYGGESKEKAAVNFRKQVHKDSEKMRYLEAAGCPVIEVHYKDKPTLEWLIERIQHASERGDVPSKPSRQSIRRSKSAYEEEMAERRRAYNRKRYREMQELRRRG
jgi:very-short-patch-repair endonuclease